MPGRTRLLIAALLLAYAAHAGFYVVSASPNVDEGFYALAAREVYR